jgi:signal peptide peptidase SppA
MSYELTREQLERIASAPMALRQDSPLMARIVAMEEFDEPPELEAQIVEQAPVAEEARAPRLPKTEEAVAVVPVYGGVAQHRGSDYWGGVFTEELVGLLSQLAGMKNIGAVVLSFDSPGGIVYGVPEAANAIQSLAQDKPIYGHVKAEAASAAYWLASATTKLFAQPSTKVGSIGVWTMHIDASTMLEEWGLKVSLISAGKFKVEGHPFGPLEDEARANLQESVDRYYDNFLAGVAAGRGVSKATVKNDFGEGRMVDPEKAKAAGMIDGIATLPELLAGVMKPGGRGARRSMASRIAIADAWEPTIDA